MEIAALALVILAGVIVVLLADRREERRAHARERERLLNAVVADTPRELAALNHEPAPRREPVEATQPPLPDGL